MHGEKRVLIRFERFTDINTKQLIRFLTNLRLPRDVVKRAGKGDTVEFSVPQSVAMGPKIKQFGHFERIGS